MPPTHDPPPHSLLPILVFHGTLSHRTAPTQDLPPIFHGTPHPSFLGPPPHRGPPPRVPLSLPPRRETRSVSHPPLPPLLLLWGSFGASWTLPPPTPQPLTSMPPKGVTGDTEVTPVLILAQGKGEEKGGAPPLCWHLSLARFLHPSPWEPRGQGHGATIPCQRVPPPMGAATQPVSTAPHSAGGGSQGVFGGGVNPFPNPAPPCPAQGTKVTWDRASPSGWHLWVTGRTMGILGVFQGVLGPLQGAF